MSIDFYRHDLGTEAAQAVADVISTPFLTTGKVARGVEEQLRGYFDVPHALLVNSWTNGAAATLLALGVEPGDEIVVPAMTFIASANVGEVLGAVTVMTDVDPDTLLMTPEAVAAAITPRTKVVIPVHLYGQMVDVAAMRQAIDTHPDGGPHIRILEDAAHCFEGTRNGERPGRHGDAAIFSFYATKNVTCGEGGAVITRDAGLAAKLTETRLHGMSAIAVDRFAGGKYNHWDMERLGTKANLPDLLAALLPPQIETVDSKLPLRRAIADRYREAFADGPLRLPAVDPLCVSAEHLITIGVPADNRDRAIAALNETGVPVTVNYRALPDIAYYRRRYPQAADQCPHAVAWGRQTISLPLYTGLSASDQTFIIEAVKKLLYPLG